MLTSHKVVSGCMILCLLILHFGKGEADSDNPVLNFTCDGYSIKSIDADDVGKVYIILKNATQVYCKPNNGNQTNCYDLTKNNVSELNVLYEKELLPNVIGGKYIHFFHLVCKDAVRFLTATASFSKITYKGNYTENVKNIALKERLTLTISETSNSVNKIQNAEVGQYLYLFMKGPAQHVINPEECTAKPTDKPGAKPAKLWKRNPSCTGSNPDLIDHNWTNKTDQLYIGMYAFRFDSSDEVTITCRAFVCPRTDPNSNCTQGCVDTINPVPKRTRRNAIVGSQLQHAEKSASASFRIVKRDTSNAAAGMSTTSFIVVFLLFTVTKWM